MKTLEEELEEHYSNIIREKVKYIIGNNIENAILAGADPNYLKIFEVKPLHWSIYNTNTQQFTYLWGDPETGALYRGVHASKE